MQTRTSSWGRTRNAAARASHMLRGGAKLEVVSRLLGHAGIGVTGDIYRHVSVEELPEENRRFAPLGGGGLVSAGSPLP